MADSLADRARHPAQWLALVLGAVFTVLGLAGFVVTGVAGFAAAEGDTLAGLGLNPLRNIVHLVTGVAGLVMWRRLDTARLFGWIVAAFYAVAFLYGLFAVGRASLNFLALNAADNWLHLVFALLGVAVARWPATGRIAVGRRGGARTA